MQASQILATGKRIEQIDDERDNKIGTIAAKYEANKE
jgi:hypothetical protein